MKYDLTGGEGVFNALYDTNYDAVRAYAWRRSPAFADDIVAETFLVAWRRLADIPADAQLPWLLAVSRNVLLNMQRGERRRREREKSEATIWPACHDDAGLEPFEEPPGAVWQALQRLPAADREILLLVAWEELDRGAIAKVLGCSRANVALRLHRARKRFQALLERPTETLEPQHAIPFKADPSLNPQGAHYE